jgi:uncharacterized protein (TIGR03084 family)
VHDLLDALAAQHAELAALVDGCTTADWERPTRCVGWDVASVLLHLAQTDELAASSARGELEPLEGGLMSTTTDSDATVDGAAASSVDRERAAGGDAIRDRWHAGSKEMQAAFAVADPHERVTWVTNPLSVQTLAATRLSECWIHTGDIATALGVEQAPTDRLRFVTRLAWRTLPYAFEQAGVVMQGPVALDLIGPNGDAWRFEPDAPARTTITGAAVEFCEVAARRIDASETGLVGVGPDADAALRLVRTYAL